MARQQPRPSQLPPFDTHALIQEMEGTGATAGEEILYDRMDARGAEWATPVPRHAELPEDLARAIASPPSSERPETPAD
jgi:hypothetical protein